MLCRVAGHPLGNASAGPSGVADAIAAVTSGAEQRFGYVRLHDARHHVVADVDPAPPGIAYRDPVQRRELGVQAVDQALPVTRACRIRVGDGATVTDLQAVVG